MRLVHATVSMGFLALLLVCSCSQDEIQEYTTTKSDFAAKPSPPGNTQPSHGPSGPEEPHWTLPAKWSEHPGTGIRFATIHVDAGDPPLELRVTPLALAARDPLANINRWAGQIGLPQYEANQLDTVMHEIQAHGLTMQLVSLTGPANDSGEAPQQILAAIVPGDQSAWFFMILGDHQRVRQVEGHFEEFMRTVHFTRAPEKIAGTMPPALSNDAPEPETNVSTASGAGGMTWRLPPHWQAQTESSNMRLATIAVVSGSETAEVTVTRFPGDVGGLLANINRWRRQLSLPAVSSLEQQPLEPVRVAGGPASFLDLVAQAGAEDADRLYVVIVPHEGMTWFLKMTGPYSFLESQRPSFDAFVASVAFGGGTPGE